MTTKTTRNEEIRNLVAAGETYREVGARYRISGERVRQIAGDSVTRGVGMPPRPKVTLSPRSSLQMST